MDQILMTQMLLLMDLDLGKGKLGEEGMILVDMKLDTGLVNMLLLLVNMYMGLKLLWVPLMLHIKKNHHNQPTHHLLLID